MSAFGLGIDFGQSDVQHVQSSPPKREQNSLQEKELPPPPPSTSHSLKRGGVAGKPARRPVTAGARLNSHQRRVRIASGKPNVLGHAAGYTAEEDVFDSPEVPTQHASFAGYRPPFVQRDSVGSIDDRVRMLPRNLTVTNPQDSSASPSPTNSFSGGSTDLSASSPGTDYSASSCPAHVKYDAGRPTLRKLHSQPNLSQLRIVNSTGADAVDTEASSPITVSAMPPRSQSTTNVAASGSGLSRGTTVRPGARSAAQRGTRPISARIPVPKAEESPRQTKSKSWHAAPPAIADPSANACVEQQEAPPVQKVIIPLSDNSRTTPNQHGQVPDGFGGWIEPETMSHGKIEDSPEMAPDEEVQETELEAARPDFHRMHSEAESSHSLSSAYSAASSKSSATFSHAEVPMHATHTAQYQQPESSQQDREEEEQALRILESMDHSEARGHLVLPASQSHRDSIVSSSSSAHSHSSTTSGHKAIHMVSPTLSADRAALPTLVTDKHQQPAHVSNAVAMRSVGGFHGLEGAERGACTVTFDNLQTALRPGEYIMPGASVVADQVSLMGSPNVAESEAEADWPSGSSSRSSVSHGSTIGGLSTAPSVAGTSTYSSPLKSSASDCGKSVSAASMYSSASQLDRHGTLINAAANPARRSRDLQRLLGNTAKSSSPLGPSSAKSSRHNSPTKASATIAETVALEKGKQSRARVEVDLLLESELVVEGGMLRGRLEIDVKSAGRNSVMLAQPKVRVVGFEELLGDDTRHIFYHHASIVDGARRPGGSQPFVLHGSPLLSSPETEGFAPLACFGGAPDEEGYCVGREGTHSIPFSLELPIGKGAKGVFRSKGAAVRYIVIGSIKLKDQYGTDRSIAHFYRHVELYPYLNPAVMLSSAPKPITVSQEKGSFIGGSNKVRLSASLHRGTWVAGQRCYINVSVENETSKRLKNVTFQLIRTLTQFKPRPEFNLGSSSELDPDACQTSTSHKKVVEETLEMGQKGSKGQVTAKGWFAGVEPRSELEFSHHMAIPSDALSISRGRHVEVAYHIRVCVGSSMSSEVAIEVPLRIINFLSLDPPPAKTHVSRPLSIARGYSSSLGSVASSVIADEAPMIAMVKSAEALRSPSVPMQTAQFEQPATSPGPNPLMALHERAARRKSAQSQQLQAPEDPRRQIQHQKSLEFINVAIRSATARRSSNSGPPPSETTADAPQGLGIDIAENRNLDVQRTPTGPMLPAVRQDVNEGPYRTSSRPGSRRGSAVHPTCLPYEHIDVPAPSFGFPFMQLPSVPLTNMADESVEEDPNQTLGLNQDSRDELDFVVGSARLENAEFDQSQLSDTIEFDAEDADLSTDTILGNNNDAEVSDESIYPAEHSLGEVRRPSVVVDSPNRTKSVAVPPPRVPFAQSHQAIHPAGPRAQLRPPPAISTPPAAAAPVLVKRASLANMRRDSNSNLRSAASSPTKGRPLSAGGRESISPSKPALKAKTSFSFATNNKPIRMAAAASTEASQSTTLAVRQPVAPVIRARAAPSQFVGESHNPSPTRKSRPLPKEPFIVSVPAPSSLIAEASVDARGMERGSSSGSSAESQEEAVTPRTAEAPFAGAVTMYDSPYGAGLGLDFVSNGPTSPVKAPRVAALQSPARGMRREGSAEPSPALSSGCDTYSPSTIVVQPTLRSSGSSASLNSNGSGNESSGMHKSGSVASKIAVLESRQNALSARQVMESPNSKLAEATASPASPAASVRAAIIHSRLERQLSSLSLSSSYSSYSTSTTSTILAVGEDEDEDEYDYGDPYAPSEAQDSAMPGQAPWMRRGSFSSEASFKAPMLKNASMTGQR